MTASVVVVVVAVVRRVGSIAVVSGQVLHRAGHNVRTCVAVSEGMVDALVAVAVVRGVGMAGAPAYRSPELSVPVTKEATDRGSPSRRARLPPDVHAWVSYSVQLPGSGVPQHVGTVVVVVAVVAVVVVAVVVVVVVEVVGTSPTAMLIARMPLQSLIARASSMPCVRVRACVCAFVCACWRVWEEAGAMFDSLAGLER